MQRLPPLPASVAAAASPEWTHDDLERRTCPACKADAPAAFATRPDGLVVSRCKVCECLYLADCPSPRALRRYYSNDRGFKGFGPARGVRGRLQRGWRALGDPRLRILEATGGVRGQRVLQVGAAYGNFLEVLRDRGALVEAVETDDGARAHLAEVEIPVTARIVPETRADVVCAFHVLEHLSDPDELVAAAAGALEPDGRLFLVLPNGGDADLAGSAWIGFRVELEHLNYFSVKSLSRLLERHGLYVEQFWLSAQPNVQRAGDPLEQDGVKKARTLARHAASALLGMGANLRAGSHLLSLVARKA